MYELTYDVKSELSNLGIYKRNLVLGGLRVKLAHYEKSGRVSYRYDVCPVCADVGSTADDEHCEQCYIEKTCKKPFVDGFRDDHEKGASYFKAVKDFLTALERVVVVGGTVGRQQGEKSGIVRKLTHCLGGVTYNGVPFEDLKSIDLQDYAVVIWMPNIENIERKFIPSKGRGAVLICSKVMREGYTRFDSVSRIFKMHANAVIEVYRDNPKLIKFALVDALGNEWVRTSDVDTLASKIEEFAIWSRGQLRFPCSRITQHNALGQQVTNQWSRHISCRKPKELKVLTALTKSVANKVERERGGRYFGNASTRCMAMFPSVAMYNRKAVYVTPRNIDKARISVEDFVLVTIGSAGVAYDGDRKPSVDTPVQLLLYNQFPEIRFMIHGHAHIKNVETTSRYFPCGDVREVDEVAKLMRRGGPNGSINLLKHGFLIYAEDEDALEDLVTKAEFINVVPLPGKA